MSIKSRGPLVAVLFLLAGIAACIGDGESVAPTEIAASSEPIKGTQVDVVRVLRYGDTDGPRPWNPPPSGAPMRYLGWQFTGASGDMVTITANASPGHQAYAWLVDASDATVAFSLNGSVRATLPRAGTYFIAVREGSLRPTAFTVSLVGLPAALDAGTTTDAAVDARPDATPSFTAHCDYEADDLSKPRDAGVFSTRVYPVTAVDVRATLGPIRTPFDGKASFEWTMAGAPRIDHEFWSLDPDSPVNSRYLRVSSGTTFRCDMGSFTITPDWTRNIARIDGSCRHSNAPNITYTLTCSGEAPLRKIGF